VYYIRFFLEILSPTKRLTIQDKNKRLEELRDIPNKTLQQQKEFVGLKYPSQNVKKKFGVSRILKFIMVLLVYASLFYGVMSLLTLMGVSFKLWQAIIIIFIVPILINFILRKFGIQKDDITVYFRRRKNDSID
jgi:hypothetical protein